MMKFSCSDCLITFSAPELDAFCPACGETADFWDWTEDEGFWPDDLSADADALAGIGWGTDEDYGYYGD